MKTHSSRNDLPGSDKQHRWAPLSYPSAAIFSPAGRPDDARHESMSRMADPFFPLHRDVLLAAMRELLLISGKIDHRTMEVISCVEVNSGDAIPTNLSTKSNLKRKGGDTDSPQDGKDGEDEFSSFKKPRTQDSSVESLPILHINEEAKQEEKSKEKDSSSHPHVVPIPIDQMELRDSFDYTKFKSSEELVDYALKQAALELAKSKRSEEDEPRGKKPQSNEKEELPMKAQRKVSDADSIEESLGSCSNDEFPPCIISLVRSNIMILEKTQSGSKLSKLSPQSGPGYGKSKSEESLDTDHAILCFLRNPRLQREQQHEKEKKSLFVLPRLLETTIEDECDLRARAYHMVTSLINTFPKDDMDIPIRAFLGYRSTKLTSRSRMLEVIADVLFDVSHAMYAWVHTEEDMMRQDKISMNKTKYGRFDRQVKASLFDDRALKRIGGFEPSALLPLAIGIRRCRQAGRSWKDYAFTKQGKKALSIHTVQIENSPGSKCNSKDDSSNVNTDKKSTVAVMDNLALLEMGKKRRGRRGKSIMTRPF